MRRQHALQLFWCLWVALGCARGLLGWGLNYEEGDREEVRKNGLRFPEYMRRTVVARGGGYSLTSDDIRFLALVSVEPSRRSTVLGCYLCERNQDPVTPTRLTTEIQVVLDVLNAGSFNYGGGELGITEPPVYGWAIDRLAASHGHRASQEVEWVRALEAIYRVPEAQIRTHLEAAAARPSIFDPSSALDALLVERSYDRLFRTWGEPPPDATEIVATRLHRQDPTCETLERFSQLAPWGGDHWPVMMEKNCPTTALVYLVGWTKCTGWRNAMGLREAADNIDLTEVTEELGQLSGELVGFRDEFDTIIERYASPALVRAMDHGIGVLRRESKWGNEAELLATAQSLRAKLATKAEAWNGPNPFDRVPGRFILAGVGDDGIERYKDRLSGLEFIRVPGAFVWRQRSSSEAERDPWRTPFHVASFLVSATPVSREAAARLAGVNRPWLTMGSDEDPESRLQGISSQEAQAVCRATGGRLPTEAEWERLAVLSDVMDSTSWGLGSGWEWCGSWYDEMGYLNGLFEGGENTVTDLGKGRVARARGQTRMSESGLDDSLRTRISFRIVVPLPAGSRGNGQTRPGVK